MIQTYNKIKIYDHKKEHLVGGFVCFFFHEEIQNLF